jgi:hypothetical protein
MKYILSVLTLSLISLAACAPAPKEVATNQPATPSAGSSSGSSGIAVGHDAAPATASQNDTGAPVKWTPPSRWEAKPASGMRAATYLIPAAAGDSEGGECAVFLNIGGGVKANIDRWINQFDAADAPNAKQKKETFNGFDVTTVDLSGTFKGGGPMMGQSTGPKSGYRLLGAVVETPEGEVFFKLTGPAKTIAAAQNEFQSMLKSLKK